MYSFKMFLLESKDLVSFEMYGFRKFLIYFEDLVSFESTYSHENHYIKIRYEFQYAV